MGARSERAFWVFLTGFSSSCCLAEGGKTVSAVFARVKEHLDAYGRYDVPSDELT